MSSIPGELGPVAIVVQTREAYQRYHEGRRLAVSYSLTHPLIIIQPYYARLAQSAGVNSSIVVFADFLRDTTHFNAQPAQFLGIAPPTAPLWIPLASNFVPSVGTLFLEPALANHPGIPIDADITLVLELAPHSWLTNTTPNGRAAGYP